MIAVENLTKTFKDAIAVNRVSFNVNEGETLVLLGTSGSGKTTTLRMINRLLEPSSGNIKIDGRNILTQSPEALRRSMGYVLQGYGLFPHYTVAENIAIVPKLLKWSKEKIEKRIDDLLHKLQLTPQHYRNVYPVTLSGGQKQRVGLARALAADPPILLMDEPFGALDPITRSAIRKEFKELDELKKKTVILVTHDVQEAFTLGTEVGLMDKGELLQLGTPARLLFHPSNDTIRHFFDNLRLQLEWQSLSLKHIWDTLAPATNGMTTRLSNEQSVWEAIEVLVNHREPIAVADKETGEIKELTFFDLQTAIQQQKVRT
jgi:osmoprotectant transport system ATP-binding protein